MYKLGLEQVEEEGKVSAINPGPDKVDDHWPVLRVYCNRN